ncbi:hypothetical protein V1525DRAFT_95799 [Lipomyces kononenkoae]|uniref:Uncharacterized protein n=1 Tax=Lipomyces kononenkoae TaxID=34357 RepID=A0ACC3TBT2_LIPKO
MARSDHVPDSNRPAEPAAPQQPCPHRHPNGGANSVEISGSSDRVLSSETDNNLRSPATKTRVRKMSPAEFQRRVTGRHREDVLGVESVLGPSTVFSSWSGQHSEASTFATAPSLRQRIEQQKLNAANHIIAQYESLFFSDHVDQRYTPIQRFFPRSVFDPSAAGASPILASDRQSEHVPSVALSFVEWCRNLRRNMFMKAQGSRTKVWDAYDHETLASRDRYDTRYNAIVDKNNAAQSNAPTLHKDSDSFSPTSSPPHSTSSSPSPSASDDGDKETRVFVDSAFPTPSPIQYKHCKLNNGLGVWDTRGVWRCLLPNSNGKFDLGNPSSPRSQLFAQFEDFIEWKIKQQADMSMPFPGQHSFDAGSPVPPTAERQRMIDSLLRGEFPEVTKKEPGANAKVVGRGSSSSTKIVNGQMKTVKKWQTYYDDGSVTETVEESEDKAAGPSIPSLPEWSNPDSKAREREGDWYKQAAEQISKSADDIMRTGANSLEKTLKVLDKARDLESSKLQDAMKKIFPFGWKDDDDNDKKNKK